MTRRRPLSQTMPVRPRLLAVVVLLAAFLSGCQSEGIVPPDRMVLSISNEASIKVDLVVNGNLVETVDPTTRLDVPASRLPPLPWAAEARLPGGRRLVAVTVHAGDVWSRAVANGGTEMSGDGARVDLSCGRIDIFSGPQPMGPAPGPGSPGDCDP